MMHDALVDSLMHFQFLSSSLVIMAKDDDDWGSIVPLGQRGTDRSDLKF